MLLWLDHRTAAGAEFAARALEGAQEMVEPGSGPLGLATDQRMAYLEALEAASDAALQQDRVEDVARSSDDILQIARGLDDETYVSALLRAAFSRSMLEQVHQALELYTRAWDTAGKLVLPVARAESGVGLAAVLFDVGRLQEARSVAVETAEIEARATYDARRYGLAAPSVHTIDLSIGDTRRALDGLRQAAREEDDPHFRLGIHQTIAEWQARFGPPSAAREVESELAAAKSDAGLAGCPRCSAELMVVSAELFARLGRIDEAKGELAAWERLTSTSPMHDVWRSKARSAIAIAEGHADRAIETLERLATELEGRGLVRDLLLARIDSEGHSQPSTGIARSRSSRRRPGWPRRSAQGAKVA